MRFAISIVLVLPLLPVAVPAAVPERVDFNFHVKPILSDRCYMCHGPDEQKRKAKLRFDKREAALAARTESGMNVIEPGDPEHSALVRRIGSHDPEEVMPPPESKLTLSADEREILRRWISQGAEWKNHWAFLPVAAPAVPQSSDARAANEIDYFVAAALEKQGLKLRPPAPRETLIRRASFALTGLPPSLDEIDAFMADASPDAFEKVLDRLLASPAYGERMAVDWCDIARYADTHGYQNDRHRDVWPWRDWVIRAFNDNLPYDQFLTWQVAGDLLENPSRDQIVATAFNRQHRQTNEGGSVEEEFRVEYVNDRVTTFGTAFLGLTLECCRCHDHKYDPISMRDFYSLFAFFQNIDESGLYSHFTDDTPTPALDLTTPDHEANLAAAEKRIAAQLQKMQSLRESRRAGFTAWLAGRPTALEIPDCTGDYPFDDLTENKANAKAKAQPFENPQHIDGRVGKGVGLDGENGINLSTGGDFTRDQPFSVSLWLKIPDHKDRAVVFHRSRAWTDSASRGYQLLIEEGKLSAALIHFWPGNAICIRTREKAPLNDWVHVVMTSDGSSTAAGLALHVNGRSAECDVIRDHLTRNCHGGDANQITIGQRFRDRGFKGGAVDEFKVFTRALTAPDAAQLATVELPAGENDSALFDYWLSAIDGAWRAEQQGLTDLRRARSAVSDAIPALMVMHELPRPKPAAMLKRGSYDAPGETVTANTPAAILAFDAAWPRNRLGLAKWATDARQPLTARVVVNRFWAQMFGHGLVATPEDFGNQGSLPSQPELLDWLAHHFVHQGWNVKALLRTIALSATWQQASGGVPELIARDPDNSMLARGPRFRLPAEMIRDNALALSGLLVRKTGGPGVKPYQPEGIWEEKGGGWSYHPDKGEGLYRRSLYTYWKRTAPPPAMETFDAAKREVCVARRQTTNTPLQALVLLNDVQFGEAARVSAERLLQQHGEDEDAAITDAFRLCTARPPTAREFAILTRLHAAQRAHFAADPAAARGAASVGEQKPATVPAADRVAAMASVISTLMSHDECVTLR